MTDSTLEKMARAMFVADSYDNEGRVWEQEGQSHAAYWQMARAALEAIRDEPDRRVLNAGAFYHIDHAGGAGEHEMTMARQSWRAMVKAILNEKA